MENPLQQLQAAADSKDVDALRVAVWALKQEPSSVPVLTRLLLEDWHDMHEDIVFELGLVGDPDAVQAIAKAVTVPFAHLVKWNNLREFQRKCAYALARIGTPESRAELESLTKHSDPHLRKYGREGLETWPLPYSRP